MKLTSNVQPFQLSQDRSQRQGRGVANWLFRFNGGHGELNRSVAAGVVSGVKIGSLVNEIKIAGF